MARDYTEGLRLEDILGANRKTYVKSGSSQKKLHDEVYVEDDEGVEHPVTMNNIRDFFIQARGFPTILCLGEVCGEGQSGGREVTEMVKQAETLFVQKYGKQGYISRMDDLMGKR